MVKVSDLRIHQIVFHSEVYWGREPFEIVGLMENEVELRGDWSGGTHCVDQRGWMPIEGIIPKETSNEQ